MSKKKSLDYNKIRKEVSQSYYNHDKMFIQLITSLSKCETKREVEYFKTLAEGFFKKDAPDVLVEYIRSSIINKMSSLSRRDDLDLSKLRAISKNNF